MASSIQARPTEYKGIVFRSKSEAILARCLDLVGDRCSTHHIDWCYEPMYDWDRNESSVEFDFFVVISKKSNLFDRQCILVEYKPRKPTQTYIKQFEQRVKLAEDFLYDVHARLTPVFFLFYFNFFDESVNCNHDMGLSVSHKFPLHADIVQRVFWHVINVANEAKSYRFDLE